jgi:hypothetical protein
VIEVRGKEGGRMRGRVEKRKCKRKTGKDETKKWRERNEIGSKLKSRNQQGT